MKHKIFRATYTNRDENFYAEFHVANKNNKKYTHETKLGTKLKGENGHLILFFLKHIYSFRF